MRKLLLAVAFILGFVSKVEAQSNAIAPRPWGQQTITFSATPTFDASRSIGFKMTLTGNVTSSTLTGAEAGMTISFEICQDGVGGRTFVWPGQLVGTAPPNSSPNQCTAESFYFEGTNGLNPNTQAAISQIQLTNGTNFVGFKVPNVLSTNLVWALPNTDSTGTQCLSSNGSLTLAWSNCSGGTGTPGGAVGNVQYNNTTFGGSTGFTFDGTSKATLGVAGTSLGQLVLSGNTSGTVNIQPQAVAGGTLTFTLPNASGTAQVSASSPLVASSTTGNLTCPTCTTNASALTNNAIVLGAGGQATQIGPAGTTTTVLHGNTSGAPTYAAVNLSTDTTGILGINAGGTGQTSAAAAFNALSPVTSAGDLIIGTGVNTAGRLAIGTNGLCLVSNGTTATWNSCAAGTIGGSGSSGQVTFWNTGSAITGSTNWTYSAGSGISLIQGANSTDAFYAKRFTDTAPTGNLLHFQNAAANSDLFKIDVNGNLTTAGTITFNSSTAGALQLNPGTPPVISAGNVQIIAPATVAGSGEQFVYPGTPANGFIRWTNSSGTLTGAFVAASGVGTCANQVVTAVNDNAVPTCSSAAANMFASQIANAFLVAPNGSSGVPTFRVMASGDIPAINLNSTSNGGVTGTLPIANGGTNGVTALAAFNNLSPMTTAGDILYGGASGSGTRLAAGTAHQLLHSGTTPSWTAVDVTADITGITPIANGGTNDTSANYSTNGVMYYDGTKLLTTAAGGAGTQCLVSTAGGTPTFGSCSGSASAAWSSLTNPSGNLSLSMGANTTVLTWGNATGSGVDMFKITDTASNTGTGFAFNINLASSSAAKPFQAAVNGNGFSVSNAGVVAKVGTGSITADTVNLNVNTTSPLGGGGALSSSLTLTCTTCVTSGSALSNNAVVVGSGGGQGTATISASTSGQILQTNGSGSVPAFVDGRDVKIIPAANCNAGTQGSGWDIPSSNAPTVACRAGTNNLGGVLQWANNNTTTNAQFSVELPTDWDTATQPWINIYYGSGANTSGTVKWTFSTACSKNDGSISDDPSFNAESATSGKTMAVANRMWAESLQFTAVTSGNNCTAGANMLVKITSGNGTATSTVNVSKVVITFPTLPKAQAN